MVLYSVYCTRAPPGARSRTLLPSMCSNATALGTAATQYGARVGAAAGAARAVRAAAGPLRRRLAPADAALHARARRRRTGTLFYTCTLYSTCTLALCACHWCPPVSLIPERYSTSSYMCNPKPVYGTSSCYGSCVRASGERRRAGSGHDGRARRASACDGQRLRERRQ